MKLLNKLGILTFIFLLTIPVSQAQKAEYFSDSNPDHPYYEAINYVKEQGIVNGYDDGTYLPDQTINRAEFTKIIMEATLPSDVFANCYRTDTFSDVQDTDWFAPYICMAYNNGIIDGYSDTIFKPEAPVNFVEASKIIINGFHYNLSQETYDDWYAPYLIELEKRNATPNSISNLDQKLTRGEMAHLIYFLKENITDQEAPHFYQFENNTYHKIQGEAQNFKMETSTTLTEPIMVTLNNLDEEGQNTMYDFDTATLGGNGVTPDLYLFQHFFGSNWMHSVDWQVVQMDASFEETTECPATGYASVTNVNEEGFGDPINPYSGDVYCLQTSDQNYVLLEILEAYNEGDDIYLNLKYYLQPNGSRDFSRKD